MGDDEYFNVLVFFSTLVKKVFTKTHEPFWNTYKQMQDWSDNATLVLRWCTLPLRTMIVLVGFSLYLAIMATEAALVATTYLILIACSIAVGILPAFIGAAACFAIICIQAFPCAYVYLAIIYRTVAMTMALKVTCFVSTPIVMALMPPIGLVVIFIIFFLWCFMFGISGYGHATWLQLPNVTKEFWKYFGEHRERVRINHSHGVPDDWDGRMYGFPVNPGIVFLSIVGYFVGLVIITPCVFLVTMFKSPAIFLLGVYEFWKRLGPRNFFTWYYSLLRGHYPKQPSIDCTRRNPRTHPVGHDNWINPVEELIVGPKDCLYDFITFCFVDVLCTTKRWIAKYYDFLTQILDTGNLVRPFYKFNKKYPLFDVLRDVVYGDNTCWKLAVFFASPVVVWIWLIYLIGIFYIVVAACILFLTFWVTFLPLVALMPLAGWIFRWIFVLIVLPILYVFTWILVFIAPWILTFLYSLSGPVLAVNIPVLLLKSNFNRPFKNLKRVIKSIGGEIKTDIKKSDDYSANYSLGHLKLCRCQTQEDQEDQARQYQTSTDQRLGRTTNFIDPGTADDNADDNGARVGGSYWVRFFHQMVSTIEQVTTVKGWLTLDNIQEMGPSTLLSIPALSILTILDQTNARNKNSGQDQEVMIYWAEQGVDCYGADKDDNIAHAFMPKLLDIKKDLKRLDGPDSSTHISWIMAKLCDGEDVKSEKLDDSLKSYDKFLMCEDEVQNGVDAIDDPLIEAKKVKRAQDHKTATQIKHKVVDTTLGLIKVDIMKKGLQNILSSPTPEPMSVETQPSLIPIPPDIPVEEALNTPYLAPDFQDFSGIDYSQSHGISVPAGFYF